MEINWSFILDLVMIAMLGGTMTYAYILNKNLNKLRAEKSEFEQSITRLTQSIRQAEAGLHDLKLAAQEVGAHLESNISIGRGLTQELQFMIQSADSLANRLTSAAETGSARVTANAEAARTNTASNARIEDTKPKSQAEARLIEELKRVEAVRSSTKSAGGNG